MQMPCTKKIKIKNSKFNLHITKGNEFLIPLCTPFLFVRMAGIVHLLIEYKPFAEIIIRMGAIEIKAIKLLSKPHNWMWRYFVALTI